MKHYQITTLKEDRPISKAETEIVTWMLLHASVAGSLEHLSAAVPNLRVVGRCPCGCPSVDFEDGGQALPAKPIADGTGKLADGTEVGVILWGRTDAITGLEFYELGSTATSLPVIGTLKA
jgi:hypothetical protein